jgi:anti-sigma factor RsiW
MDRPFHPSDTDLIFFADGEVPGTQTARIETHLGYCADCRSRLNQFRNFLSDYDRYHASVLKSSHEIPADSWPSLRARKPTVHPRSLRWAFAALFCLLAVLAGYRALWPGPPALVNLLQKAAASEPPPTSQIASNDRQPQLDSPGSSWLWRPLDAGSGSKRL